MFNLDRAGGGCVTLLELDTGVLCACGIQQEIFAYKEYQPTEFTAHCRTEAVLRGLRSEYEIEYEYRVPEADKIGVTND